MSGYPAGTEFDSKAPWNEEDKPGREITVTVSITLSKTMTVMIDDYEIVDSGIDEDGCSYPNIDVSNCNLEKAIEQHYLPQEAYRYIDYKDIKADLKDWVVDELVVIPE